jgi:hypothetical protein
LFLKGQLIASARATYALCENLIEYDVVLCATILNSENLRNSIVEAYREDELTQTNIKNPQHPWSKSNSGLLLHENCVYIPDVNNLCLQILHEKHNHPTAGHQGFKKTYDLIPHEFYWPLMRKLILDYCTTCDAYPHAKPSCDKPYGLLKQLPIPERPWKSISLDFIMELLPSKSSLDSRTFDSILVIVNRLTKMAIFIPTVRTITTQDLTKLYLLHVFSKHGIPSNIISDCGTLFTSNFSTSLMQLLNMKLKFSTAYHPEINGQTECMNQSLKGYLRLYCNYQQDNWSDLLPIAEFAYNNSTHSATQVSPFFANYGYHPHATLSLNVTVRDSNAHNFSQSLSKLYKYC